jgi:hypothetical protein
VVFFIEEVMGMAGSVDLYHGDDSYDDYDAIDSFLKVKAPQKRRAMARDELEKRLERKRLRKDICEFYEDD